MKIIERKKTILLLALVFLLALTFGITGCKKDQTAEAGLSSSIANDAGIMMEASGAFSVQYALIDNGKVTVNGNAGLYNVGLNKDTFYGTADISKMFTGVAVMKLVDDGKIKLDEPVVTYLPDFKMLDDRYKKITIRMLLNHSSGLMGTEWPNKNLFLDRDQTVKTRLLTELSRQRLKSAPGEMSTPADSGYDLLGLVIEKVSGKEYSEYIHEEITAPCGMDRTRTPLTMDNYKEMAGVYISGVKGRILPEYSNAIPSSGVISTAEDMAKFSQVFMDSRDSKVAVISDDSRKAMAEKEYRKGLWPEDADSSENLGLGWSSVELYPFTEYKIKALASGGNLNTYHSAMIVLPEKNMAAVVLSSGGDAEKNQILAAKMLLHNLKTKGEIKKFENDKSFSSIKQEKVPADVMANAGYYVSSGKQFRVRIGKSGVLTLSDRPKEKYTYSADGSFISEDGSRKLTFVTEKNEKTYIWEQSYTTIKGVGQAANSAYIGQKTSSVKLSSTVRRIWRNRNGRNYYPVNLKYTNDMYQFGLPIVTVDVSGQDGYIHDRRFVSRNRAESSAEVPGVYGSNGNDLRIHMVAGTEFMKVNETRYIAETEINNLSTNRKFGLKIGSRGFARWFNIPKADAGRTMTVKVPANAAFAVYDSDGKCVNYSLVSKKNSCRLPRGGKVVFMGSKGKPFWVRLK